MNSNDKLRAIIGVSFFLMMGAAFFLMFVSNFREDALKGTPYKVCITTTKNIDKCKEILK